MSAVNELSQAEYELLQLADKGEWSWQADAVAFVNEGGRDGVWDAPTLRAGNKGKREYDVGKMANKLDLPALREPTLIAFAVLEKVHAMPGQGVVSMFTFGPG